MTRRLNQYAIGGSISAEAKAALVHLLVEMGMCASPENAQASKPVDRADLVKMLEAGPAKRLVLYAMNRHSGDIIGLCRAQALEIRIFSRDLGAEGDHWVQMYVPRRRLDNGGVRRGMDIVFKASATGRAVVGGSDVEERLNNRDGKYSFERLAGDLNMASHIESIEPLSAVDTTYTIKDISCPEDADEFQRGSTLTDIVPALRIVHAHGGVLFGLYRNASPIGVFSLRKGVDGNEHRGVEIIAGAFGLAEEESAVIDGFIAERAEHRERQARPPASASTGPSL